MKAQNLQPELVVDCHHGIYIPQVFARTYGLPENFTNWDEIKEDIEFLQAEDSVDKEEYFDVWSDVIDTAKLTVSGNEYYLYTNDDLWAVPIGYVRMKIFSLNFLIP
jgi:hypothetical protein